MNQIEKEILKILYINQNIKIDRGYLETNLLLDKRNIEDICKNMEKKKLISKINNEYFINEKGKSKLIIVMIGGVFDIIHPGHIITLKSAKNLGDVLVVSVARDQTVLKYKKHKPINEETKRCELINSIKYVDLGILGSKKNIFDTVIKLKPNIIALGYDQKHNEEKLKNKIDKLELDIKLVRLKSPIPDIKSSEILKNPNKIKDF
tara:strand:+ start:369 stop:986 length:618 start_codon:yes stop_codon:yes gene_type:complete